MRPKTEAATNQTAAKANSTTTGTRHEASIAAGEAAGTEEAAGDSMCDDEEVALIKNRGTGSFQLASYRIVPN